MKLYKKILNRIENGDVSYDNIKLSIDLAAIAKKHFKKKLPIHGVSVSVFKTETRFYLFENNSTNETENNFISQILLHSKKVQKYKVGIGEFILGITSRFDDSSKSDNSDVLDIIFNFRKQINKKKEYSRKPNPQRYWKGEWEVFINDNFI
jgi:hypothetical protein